METKVNTFFVSEKISKIRWVPEQRKECDRFVTGSWDMQENLVRLWRLKRNQYADCYNELTPECSLKIPFDGDITGIEFITSDMAAASCSDGYVALMRFKRAVDVDLLEDVNRSPTLHQFEKSGIIASCTSFSIYDKDMATVGEDGRLNIIDISVFPKVRRSIIADSSALLAVTYVNPKEIFVANRMGIIKMFDARVSTEETPTTSFMISSEDEKYSNFVSCLTSHPTQSHVVLAGSEEGSITVWDLRQPSFPASYLSAHSSAITEIGFHHSDPTKLYSAAEGGELWLWAEQSSIEGIGSKHTDNINPWLNGERTRSRINVTSLLSELRKSVNSFDSHGSKIICGSDNEAVYFIDTII